MFFEVGEIQWPITPAPITSVMNSYFSPFQANSVGHELPRRSSSRNDAGLFTATSISSCSTPVGHSMRTISAFVFLPRPARISRRSLAQVARAACDFKLLPQSVGEDFDLGSQPGLVVGQAFEVDAQRVVLVAALVVQNDWIAAQLRDQKVGGEIVVEVSGDQRARIVQLQFVESERRADIFESLRALVAEYAQLQFPSPFRPPRPDRSSHRCRSRWR